jgi:hypothetical protein
LKIHICNTQDISAEALLRERASTFTLPHSQIAWHAGLRMQQSATRQMESAQPTESTNERKWEAAGAVTPG